jgi:hypothetical protein
MMQRQPYAGVNFIPPVRDFEFSYCIRGWMPLEISYIQPAGTAKYFQFPPQTGLILPSDRPKSFRVSTLVTLRISGLVHNHNLFIAFFV